jgi:hypothetical protein
LTKNHGVLRGWNGDDYAARDQRGKRCVRPDAKMEIWGHRALR